MSVFRLSHNLTKSIFAESDFAAKSEFDWIIFAESDFTAKSEFDFE